MLWKYFSAFCRLFFYVKEVFGVEDSRRLYLCCSGIVFFDPLPHVEQLSERAGFGLTDSIRSETLSIPGTHTLHFIWRWWVCFSSVGALVDKQKIRVIHQRENSATNLPPKQTQKLSQVTLSFLALICPARYCWWYQQYPRIPVDLAMPRLTVIASIPDCS